MATIFIRFALSISILALLMFSIGAIVTVIEEAQMLKDNAGSAIGLAKLGKRF